MAEAVFRRHTEEAGLLDRIEVASAGTGRWHLGEPPHPGTLDELRKRSMHLPDKRAQHVSDFDLDLIDYIVPMDESNRRALATEAPLLLEYAGSPMGVAEVPDPFYEGGFDNVYRLIEAGSAGLLQRIIDDYDLAAG